MSTAARKARKRAGIPFTKAPKIPTPVEQRAFVTQPVPRRFGDAMPAGMARAPWAPRSPKRVAAFIASGGRKNVPLPRKGQGR
jgi:hypothetical protein